jgi:plasmid maintenance system antidote protein VapI
MRASTVFVIPECNYPTVLGVGGGGSVKHEPTLQRNKILEHSLEMWHILQKNFALAITRQESKHWNEVEHKT